jgi:hypothetical protein
MLSNNPPRPNERPRLLEPWMERSTPVNRQITIKPRPKQGPILEAGYFIGKLHRGSTCALKLMGLRGHQTWKASYPAHSTTRGQPHFSRSST